MKQLISNVNNGKSNFFKKLEMSWDVTDWYDVAVGREGVCNRKGCAIGARYFSEFDSFGRWCKLLEMGGKMFQKN